MDRKNIVYQLMIWGLLVMTIKQGGQSIVEVIFSVGVLVLVITAVIGLIIKTTGIKSMEFQRKKASEMSEIIVENLLEIKKNHSEDFWGLSSIINNPIISGYDGYSYVVGFSPNYEGNCSDTEIECFDATITISWGNGQTFTVKRFFSKKM
jgi:hypothetical protein